jgi:hypothetical protein
MFCPKAVNETIECTGPFTTLVHCPSCIEEIKNKNKRDWTDIDIDLMSEFEFRKIIGIVQDESHSLIEITENYRLLRAMDRAANLKLNSRFELLKRN